MSIYHLHLLLLLGLLRWVVVARGGALGLLLSLGRRYHTIVVLEALPTAACLQGLRGGTLRVLERALHQVGGRLQYGAAALHDHAEVFLVLDVTLTLIIR